MGCDVHGHFEVQINGKWEHYSTPNIHRNYALFEKMAGVRGSVSNAIAPPKGLPEDVSLVTKIAANYMGMDGHSHSWLSSSEFKEMYNFHKALYELDDFKLMSWWKIDEEQYGHLFENGFEGFEPGDGGYPKEIEDFRLVFWFDN